MTPATQAVPFHALPAGHATVRSHASPATANPVGHSGWPTQRDFDVDQACAGQQQCPCVSGPVAWPSGHTVGATAGFLRAGAFWAQRGTVACICSQLALQQVTHSWAWTVGELQANTRIIRRAEERDIRAA